MLGGGLHGVWLAFDGRNAWIAPRKPCLAARSRAAGDRKLWIVFPCSWFNSCSVGGPVRLGNADIERCTQIAQMLRRGSQAVRHARSPGMGLPKLNSRQRENSVALRYTGTQISMPADQRHDASQGMSEVPHKRIAGYVSCRQRVESTKR